MLSIGQKVVAFGALALVVGVSFLLSPVLSFLLVPVSIVTGVMLWKL